MVGCGLACPGGGGAGVSGCEFRGSGWGWDRRCQDAGAWGLGRGGGGDPGRPVPSGGEGGSNTEHRTIYTHTHLVPTWNTLPTILLDTQKTCLVEKDVKDLQPGNVDACQHEPKLLPSPL